VTTVYYLTTSNTLTQAAPGTTTLSSPSVSPASSTDQLFTAGTNDPSTDGTTGTHVVTVPISGGNTALQLSVQVVRTNSAGTAQTSSSFTAEQQASAGTKTFTLTSINLGTWASGDRYRVVLRWRNTNAHGGTQSATISIGESGARSEAPWTFPPIVRTPTDDVGITDNVDYVNGEFCFIGDGTIGSGYIGNACSDDLIESVPDPVGIDDVHAWQHDSRPNIVDPVAVGDIVQPPPPSFVTYRWPRAIMAAPDEPEWGVEGQQPTAFRHSTDGGCTWSDATLYGGLVDPEFGIPSAFNIGVDLNGYGGASIRSAAVQSDGKIVIGGFFTTARGVLQNFIARLNTDGSLDTGFNTGSNIGTNGAVYAVAVQSDGKIVIGGSFARARGVLQNFIARLNTDGTLDTGFNVGGTVGVNGTVIAVAIQSDGKIVIGGQFTTARGTTQNRIARLNTDGTLDTGFNTGSDIGVTGGGNYVNAIAIQGDGKIVIGGSFATARGVQQNKVARLNTDGSLDTGFNTGSDIGVTGGGTDVDAVAVQSDGKIVIGGSFTTARGVTQNRIARLNTDGTLDTGFNTGSDVGTNGIVWAVAVQSDGKIVIGGQFTTARGVTQNYIARLNTDGTLDTGFNTGTDIGTNGAVYAVAVQSDGKIVIGGLFTTARGVTQNRIARLNTDGTLDTGFNTGSDIGTNGIVGAIAIQSDGKIVIGGFFPRARGVLQNYIARLNTDGTLDTGFNTGSDIGTNGFVRAIAIQSDGKIVIGGEFTTARGTTVNRIARLETDGTLDTGFNTGSDVGTDSNVSAIAIQSDGKIVIGGQFTTARGVTQNRIARLNTDGTLDTGFNTGSDIGTNGLVIEIAIQSDGKIVIGGNFVTARGVTQNRIARLNTDGTLDTGFNTGSDIGVDGTVGAVAIQSDGKIVIGGYFTTARGVLQNYIARLNTDGTLDTGFNTGSDIGVDGVVFASEGSYVTGAAIQSDGRIVISGNFLAARGVIQNGIAQLNADGSLDASFNFGPAPGFDSAAFRLALQTDGRVVVGGYFLFANGVLASRITRTGVFVRAEVPS